MRHPLTAEQIAALRKGDDEMSAPSAKKNTVANYDGIPKNKYRNDSLPYQ